MHRHTKTNPKAISKVAFTGSRTVSASFFITPSLSVKASFGGVFSDNRGLALTAQILPPVSHNDYAFPILLDQRSQRQRYAFRLRTSTCIRLSFPIETAHAQKRPPFVKKNFHRAPHGDPTGDDKAFAKDDRQCSCALTSSWLMSIHAARNASPMIRLVRPF